MKINLEDLDKYENQSHYPLTSAYNVYAFLFDSSDDMEQAAKQFKSLYARMVYDIKKSENCSDISFILGLSCHDGKNCYRSKQKSGSKGGRPAQLVIGRATKKHIHGYISLSNEAQGLYSLTKKIVDKQNKYQQKQGLKQGRYWRNSNKENHNFCCMPLAYVRQQSEPNFYREYGNLTPFENS